MAEAAVESGEVKTTKPSTPVKKEMKLCDLKVADLKAELERRGLDKTGVKAALAERLGTAIKEEGQNPDEFIFEMNDSSAKKVKKDEKLSNDVKHETDNEDEEMEEEKSESRDAEVLQLSLDQEDNIDAKESPEDEQSEMNGSQEGKVEKSESSANSVKDKSEAMETEADDDDTEKSASQTTAASASTPAKGKLLNKNSKIVAKTTKGLQFAKSIWITNLPVSTRAADLKSFFNKHGKVNLVKIVTNARQTSGEKKFYGYITMTTSKEASKAVQELNNTELNGQPVKLELTNDQPNALLRKTTTKPVVKKVKAVSTPTRVTAAKAKEKVDTKDTKTEVVEEADDKESKDDKANRRDRERDHRSRERRDYRDFRRPSFRRPFGFRGGRGRGSRGGFSSFRERPPSDSFRRPFGRKPFFGRGGYRPPMKTGFMAFKMREERQRERFRERSIRESERRRAEESFRQKLIERKQREEAYRLEREKVQIRIERELLEREKAEYLKTEREKQRLERERIEREREKLRRQAQMRDIPSKRPFQQSPIEREPLWEKEKRARHYESRYPSYSEKPSSSESRQEFREPPPYRAKFDHRPDHYERVTHSVSTSRSDFSKYSKEKPDSSLRDHDERRVYKRPYFKEDSGRGYPPRETERYAPPIEDRGYKRKIHENLRSPRPRGGGGGRRMPYY